MFRNRQRRDTSPKSVTSKSATADGATALEAENRRLRHSVAQLSLLNDLARAVGMAANTQAMIEAIVHQAKQALEAEAVMIYLVQQDGGVDSLKTRIREESLGLARSIHFDAALCAVMDHHRSPFLANDPHHEPLLTGVALDPSLRSLLCVPLLVKGKLTGVITACNKQGDGRFTDEDQRLLAIMANQSAQVLEARRLREEQAAYAGLLQELQMARDIQMALLPQHAPALPGYDIAGFSVPAASVGGDCYDYIPLPDGRLAICLGDVSGKGVPASLLMVKLQTTLRSQALLNPTASACVAHTNRLLYESTTSDKFATAFYGVLDPRTHELTYCNAGHERPLLMSCTPGGDCTEELAAGGLVLGVLEETAYEEGRVSVAPGSLLLIYSDGLTDAVDADDRPFGVEAVQEVLRGLKGATADAILTALRETVRRHVGAAPPFDDLTLVAVRRLPEPG